MHETTIARQAQIYFATAGSSALLLGEEPLARGEQGPDAPLNGAG